MTIFWRIALKLGFGGRSSPGNGSPATGLYLENGNDLLLENGDFLLKE